LTMIKMDTLHFITAPEYIESPNMPLIKTLLVDDDEDDFVLIRDLLSEVDKVSFTVDWVPNFEEAFSALKRNKHDVCLLDYRLGRHDGLEILELIEPETISMPIIFLTGQGDYEVDTMAMKAGVEDYLSKDEINPSLLERTIRYAIERKRSKTALTKAYAEMEQKVLSRTAELSEANERIKESSEKIKHFAFSVSHDLKNPAIGIHGLTRRLYNDYSEKLGNRGKKICTQILHASEQIAFLVENINLYINTKEMPVRYETLRLSEICRIIREEFSALIAERGIEWSQPDENPLIKADRISILRALRNLVDNSLKYGGDSLSAISVTYRDSEEYHIISIKDNGAGLIDEDSQKIFGLFFRGKNLKTIDGTGMGLAIVKEIAEQHGGRVWVESDHDKGLTISMSFSKLL
jgi:signal transduction histidine kinase